MRHCVTSGRWCQCLSGHALSCARPELAHLAGQEEGMMWGVYSCQASLSYSYRLVQRAHAMVQNQIVYCRILHCTGRPSAR